MPVNLLRRILALLTVTAYAGATMLQVPPTFAANAGMSSSMAGMMHEQDGQNDKMPCKGMQPNCITDIGCIFLVTLPSPDVDLFTRTSWSSVIYDSASDAFHGRTIKPALGPPIALA
jgi:hypothetical protein